MSLATRSIPCRGIRWRRTRCFGWRLRRGLLNPALTRIRRRVVLPMSMPSRSLSNSLRPELFAQLGPPVALLNATSAALSEATDPTPYCGSHGGLSEVKPDYRYRLGLGDPAAKVVPYGRDGLSFADVPVAVIVIRNTQGNSGGSRVAVAACILRSPG